VRNERWTCTAAVVRLRGRLNETGAARVSFAAAATAGRRAGGFRALAVPAEPRAGTYRLSHRLPGQSGAATSRPLGGHRRVNHIFTRPPRTPNLLSAPRIGPPPLCHCHCRRSAVAHRTAPPHAGRAVAGSPRPARRADRVRG